MACALKQSGGLYSRLRIGAVLLAAGEGKRMGGIAKPLIRLQGVPLIARHLIALSSAGVDEVVVVTGFAREAVEEHVRRFIVTLAHNDAYAEGEDRSVRVGLAALSGNFDAVFIVLADQPLVGGGDFTELIGAFKKRPGGNIVVPMVQGQRGNPILLDAVGQACILSGEANAGYRQIVDRRPELVHLHQTDNARFVSDLDTVEDVEELARRTGWKLEFPALEAVR